MANWDITTSSEVLEFETQDITSISSSKPLAVDTNHFIVFYSGFADDGYAEVLTVNTSTWAVTTANARLEFDTVLGQNNSACQIDANHFINVFTGNGSDGWAWVFEVNTTTWAATTVGTAKEFNTSYGLNHNLVQIDDNHFINFYAGLGDDGFAQVLAVDTSTWAVTTASAGFEFDTQNSRWNSAAKIDDNHFINFWQGGAATYQDAFVQVFTVNTTTWGVTTAASSLQFDTDNGSTWVNGYNSCYKIDTNHFINFWSNPDVDGFVQVFTVNTTTWEVTTAAAPLEFDTQNYLVTGSFSVTQLDTNHFLKVWAGPDTDAGTAYDGFAQVFTVNTSTWEITTAAASFEFNTTQGEGPFISEIIAGTSGTTTKLLIIYSGSGDDGYAQVLNVEVPSGAASAIKTINGLAKASVKTVNGLAIASVKTWNGLA